MKLYEKKKQKNKHAERENPLLLLLCFVRSHDECSEMYDHKKSFRNSFTDIHPIRKALIIFVWCRALKLLNFFIHSFIELTFCWQMSPSVVVIIEILFVVKMRATETTWFDVMLILIKHNQSCSKSGQFINLKVKIIRSKRYSICKRRSC